MAPIIIFGTRKWKICLLWKKKL